MKNTIVERNYGILLEKYIKQNYGIKKLNTEEKVQFSCDYHRIFGNTSIIDIIEENLQNVETKKYILKFIQTNCMTKISKLINEQYSGYIFTNIGKTLKKEYDENNWLEEYNEEKEFTSKGRIKPVYYNYLRKDGSILTIDKDTALQIKNKLIENSIYPSNCTVRSAFKYYANNELEEYINKLKQANINMKDNSLKYDFKIMPTNDDSIALINLIKKSPIKLSNSDKIKFAYQYYNELGNISIIDILEKSINDKELRKPIINFISSNSMRRQQPSRKNIDVKSNTFSINEILKDICPKSFKTFSYEYNYQNWLEEYDEEEQFNDTKNQYHQKISILCKDNTVFTIDKNTARKIKLSLIENEIFPAVCIVKGAFKPVAENTFDQYIKTIKNGGHNNG